MTLDQKVACRETFKIMTLDDLDHGRLKYLLKIRKISIINNISDTIHSRVMRFGLKVAFVDIFT